MRYLIIGFFLTTSVLLANSRYENIIESASMKYRVPPRVITAVIKQESNFYSRALSDSGAMGLMQLMPMTAKELGVKDVYDPNENIHAGTRYLSRLLKRYSNNLCYALAAYNWGMARVDSLKKKHGKSCSALVQFMPIETQNYIARIMKNLGSKPSIQLIVKKPINPKFSKFSQENIGGFSSIEK